MNTVTLQEIHSLFSEYGTVESVQLITDRDTGRPRGFGFVEMSTGGSEAISALNGTMMDGKALNVSEARPRTDRPRPHRER